MSAILIPCIAAVGLVAATAFGALHLSRAVPPTWTGQVAAEAVPDELTIDGHRLHSYDMELDEQTLTILETRDYIYKRYVRAGTPPVDFCLIFSQDNRKLGEKIPPDFLDALDNLYDYRVLQEVKEAIYFYNREQLAEDIQDYLFAVSIGRFVRIL